MKKYARVFLPLVLFLALPLAVFAQQACTDPDQGPCAVITNLSDKANCLNNMMAVCQKQADTLSGEINYMNNQIKLTTLKINSTRISIDKLTDEIKALGDEILRLEDTLNQRLALLMKRVPESYKRLVTPQFGLLFLSNDFADFITRIKYLERAQAEDAAVLFQVKATQNNYSERKATREDKKTQLEEAKRELESQNIQLTQQKQAKDALLTQTQGQEATYAQLRQEALARLASFASFTQGLGLLKNQTSCDGWGCYYSQRDEQWGGKLINGQNTGCGQNYDQPCTVLSVGCLITSVAMMASHLGHKDILPVDIASSSPFNFYLGSTADLKRGTISVKGYNITRSLLWIRSKDDYYVNQDSLKNWLNNGPVIIGTYVPSGTHFVVIKSYTNGTYIMNDPVIPVTENGHDISFTDHYSLGSVFEVDRVSM